MNIIKLKEEERLVISKDQLDDEAASIIHRDYEQQVSIDYDGFEDQYILRSNGYVGYIPINESYSLEIRPKVDVKNLFRMLEYAYKLKSFELFPGTTSVESIEDLFENLANILAKRILDRNRRGLYRSYVERTESLPYVRGRLQTVPTALSVQRGSARAVSRYEEITADLKDNQILLWTIYQMRRIQIKRDDVKRTLRKAYLELIHKVSLSQTTPQECIGRSYNRLNQDYQPLHGLCRFFLEQLGPKAESGNYVFIPFVIYMPNLFESFVAEWLRQNIDASRYRVDEQYRGTFDSEGKFEFKIDLVMKDTATRKILAVLDTKYKSLPKPDNTDLYQVVTYAEETDAKNAFLIYPSKTTESFDLQIGNIHIRRLLFDIGQDLERSGQMLVGELCQSKIIS